jgi:galactose mutarotase-like enzyme
VVLENDALRVVVLPDMGAKIASLVDRCSGTEWLVGPTSHHLRAAGAGASFEGAEMFGWDEMFPTVTGEGLPDHGEAWSVSWDWEAAPFGLVTSLQCQTVSVFLTRHVTLDGPVLTLEYTATNAADHSVEVLWAAHPQFDVPEGTLLSVDGCDAWTGVYGEALTAPAPCADVLQQVGRGQAAKWWSGRDERPFRATLRQPHGASLAITWDANDVPHLGVWVDHHCISASSVLALEPSTGWYDDLNLARSLGTACTIAPRGTIAWRLTVGVGRPDPSL